MAAQKMGLKAKIVMPIFTPSIKVNNVRNMGAEVVLHGNDFDGAKKECLRLRDESGILLIIIIIDCIYYYYNISFFLSLSYN